MVSFLAKLAQYLGLRRLGDKAGASRKSPLRDANPSDADANAQSTISRNAKITRFFAAYLLTFLEEIGILARLVGETVRWTFRRPFHVPQLLEAMRFIGVGSIFIVGLTGLFVGMVFSLQLVDGFRLFGAENMVGGVIGIALARELAPVFSALMVSARAGSAMATQLGSMRATAQIDALWTMAVQPVNFLVVPRVVAATLMVPLLTILFDLIGIFGAWLVGVKLLGLDPGIFVYRVRMLTDPTDVSQGLVKAACFGFALAVIAGRQGYFARGGAQGVGEATNRAVVQSAVAILVLDYFISDLILKFMRSSG